MTYRFDERLQRKRAKQREKINAKLERYISKRVIEYMNTNLTLDKSTYFIMESVKLILAKAQQSYGNLETTQRSA